MTNHHSKERSWIILMIIFLLFLIVGCTQQFSRVKHSYEPTSIADKYNDDYQLHNLDCADSNVKTWAKVFGGPGFEEIASIQQTLDGGYVVAGYRNSGPTDSEGEKQYDILLFKVDAEGNKLWDKIYGGDGTDFPRSMQMTADGGFILGGATRSLGGGDAYLIKTDAEGNLQWEKNYGICGTNTYGSEISAVQQTADGGYIASGWTSSCSSTKEYNFLLKTDATGNKMWETDYIFWRATYIDTSGRNLVIQTSDEGYAVLGYVHHWIPGKVYGQDIYLMKANADGDILWNKTYKRTEWDMPAEKLNYTEWSQAYSIQETTDGGFIIVGSSGGVLVLKTDANGNKEWAKVIGEGQGHSVRQTEDGYSIIGTVFIPNYENRIMIAGDKALLDNGGTIYFLRTDANGNIVSETLGEKRYGGAIWPILKTSDGGYIDAETIFTRLSIKEGANTTDILLMKLNEDGILCNITYGQPCTLVPEPRWVNDPACRDVVYDEEYMRNPCIPEQVD